MTQGYVCTLTARSLYWHLDVLKVRCLEVVYVSPVMRPRVITQGWPAFRE